jgi:5-methylcytosine-specific restriction endonuclease McrA
MPSLRRPCPGRCGRLIASPAKRCPACQRARYAARGTRTERGLGWDYQRQRARILATYNRVCWICGTWGADTVDHVVPRARGGGNNEDNLRPAHARCNYRRRA